MKTIQDIAKLLPDGLSEAGLKEVLSLIESTVAERVKNEKTLLEAKVTSFLRTKIDELKKVAQQELESEESLIKGYRIFEQIKRLVAEEVDSSDIDSLVAKKDAEIKGLKENLSVLNLKVTGLVSQNTMLNSRSRGLIVENKDLLTAAKLPFKSSEKAYVITNETNKPKPENTNVFLTEEILSLAHGSKRLQE